MIKIRIFAIVAGAVILAAVRAPAQGVTTFKLVGASQRICQLVGQTDWVSNLPTAAQTLANFGMFGSDLGTPVDSGGPTLYFLFGDTWPSLHPPPIGVKPPDDAIGTSTMTATPTSNTCLDLQVATVAGATPPKFSPPTVTPAIDQGYFNVPSGGVYADPLLDVFFWTNHCSAASTLAPSPSDPLVLPTATPSCPETASLNSIGSSVLGQSAGSSDVAFTTPTVGGAAVKMPSGFVYVNAVDATHKPNLAPSGQQLGVFITGIPRYRASVPYLAYSTTKNLADPSKWLFFSSGSAANWITYTSWESNHNTEGRWVPPAGAEIYSPPTSEECIGEHSLSWNEPLNAWLLLYNCKGFGIEARYAPAPWGPWSDPIVLLSPAHDPGVACTLIMSVKGCPGLTDYWPNAAKNKEGEYTPGGPYAPFIISRLTQNAAPSGTVSPLLHRATIYWLVSTWNPYVVVVMQSTLQIAISE
jgi:hypothetical protein